MRATRTAVVALATLAASAGPVIPARASFDQYSSRELFEAAAPGLPVEDFETGLVENGVYKVCASPLTHGTEDPSCFASGALVAGPIYRNFSSYPSTLRLTGAGWMGATSKNLAINNLFDVFTVEFPAPGVENVGFAVISDMGQTHPCTIAIYDVTGGIRYTSSPCDEIGSSFIGFARATAPIVRVEISDMSFFLPGYVGLDNLEFGTLTHLQAHPALVDTSRPDVPLKLSATLTRSSDAEPIPGKTVDFAAGSFTCSGTTDASGIASCSDPLALVNAVTAGVYTARFRGSYPYAASTSSAGLIAYGA